MQYRGKLLFTHRLLLTSSVLITYERTGILSSKITLKTIEVTKRLPESKYSLSIDDDVTITINDKSDLIV